MTWSSHLARYSEGLEELRGLLYLGSKEASGTHAKLLREPIDHDPGLNWMGFSCVILGFQSSKDPRDELTRTGGTRPPRISSVGGAVIELGGSRQSRSGESQFLGDG